MNSQEMPEVSGGVFGLDSALELIARAQAVCLWEQQRIELTNQSALVAKKAEYGALLVEEKTAKDRLARVEKVPGENTRGRRIVINWIVASVLMMAGFVLSVLTLEPFRLGVKGVVYSIAVALTAPFLVERVLDHFPSAMFRRVVLALACLAAIASVILLASIRGKLLGEEIRQNSSAAVVNGEESENNGNAPNRFYEDTVPLLQLVMALLALSMEVGAGIAVFEAERMSETVDGEYAALKQDLREVQGRLSFLVQDIVSLQNEAALFAAQFWRDFYWALLKGIVKDGLKRLAVPTVLLMLVCPVGWSAPHKLDLGVALDLSRSVDAKGADGKTIFEKDVAGITDLLGKIPPGTRVTVFGITENSFSNPYIILSASLGTDEGYFGEKLANGRRQIVQAWKARSVGLAPTAQHTDILGALMLASTLFKVDSDADLHVLVIYSDMQQSTTTLKLDNRWQRASSVADRAERDGLVANLQGVNVYICAIQSPLHTFVEWTHLKTFWEAYFRQAGATLEVYSVFEDVPNLN